MTSAFRTAIALAALLLVAPLFAPEEAHATSHNPADAIRSASKVDVNDVICGLPGHNSATPMENEELVLPEKGIQVSKINKCVQRHAHSNQIGSGDCCCIKSGMPVSAGLSGDSFHIQNESVDLLHPESLSDGFQKSHNALFSLTQAPDPFPPQL